MEWPEPMTDEPTLETLMEWADKGGCQATDAATAMSYASLTSASLRTGRSRRRGVR